ncbi:protein sieve element occlusion b [Quercus suber]|uniref:Protein sieve element occlusion b n=1 Tax=Quercus suber TaxID=58331 RepID=A0AAW0LLA4_QUESU
MNVSKPLHICTAKQASIEVLRRKIVLLFITDLEIPYEELSILEQMYTESRHQQSRPESQYEVVWIPVVDKSTPWNADKQKQFDNLQGVMPWYLVFHPSLLEPAGIRHIKEAWKFTKKPLLVVLDPLGKPVNENAVHMMWIWGSVSDGKIICLFGGEDIEWVRKFTNTARTVARAANVPIEMLYVGKSNPREKVRKNNSIIAAENLSQRLTDLTLIWFFWVRLESMWHNKIQHGKSVENDSIMQEIMTMLSFDRSE